MKIKAMAVIKITISCLIFFNSINTCFAADFPSTYEKSSEKVKFDCELEIPKDFSETEAEFIRIWTKRFQSTRREKK